MLAKHIFNHYLTFSIDRITITHILYPGIFAGHPSSGRSMVNPLVNP